MKLRVFLFFFIILNANSLVAQSFNVVNNQTATVLANKLKGIGINILNPTISCNGLANGIFTNSNSFPSQSLSIDSGVILCTGKVLSTSSDTGINANRFILASNNLNISSSDAQITSIVASGAVQKDLCYLQFDFIPEGDSAFINYTFASEDYPEYSCSQFVDAFGIFVSGPSIATPTNYAKVPGTSVNVSINSINDTTKQTGAANYSTYCLGLGSGAPFIQYYKVNSINNHIVYDGMTSVLKSRIKVTPFQTHTMKIAISDIKDGNFDSGVFLEAASFISPPLLKIIEKKSTNGQIASQPFLIEGCNPGVVKFSRAVTTAALTINVTASGTASASDYSFSTSFTIPIGTTNYNYNVYALLDGLVESAETLKLNFSCAAIGFNDSATYIIKDFSSGVTVFNATNDTSICNLRSATLTSKITDTNYTSAWTPSTNLSCTNCTNTVYTANSNTFKTDTVYLRISTPGCSPVDSPVFIHIQPIPIISLAPSYNLCKGDSFLLNATASPSGGSYTYLWQSNASLSSTNISNPFASPLVNTNYKVYVSTSLGCKDSMSTSINVSTIRSEIDSISTVNSSCGMNNGKITIYTKAMTPSFGPYLFSINGGTNYMSSNVFVGLAPGTYNVSIKNIAGCKFDTSITIIGGANAPIATFVKTNTTCGLSNGSANITSKSGVKPFTYLWKLASATISTDTFISNVPSGLYVFSILDSVGCIAQYSVNILSSTSVNFNSNIVHQSCSLPNGTIAVSPTSGFSPFTYSWSTGETSNNISGKVSGWYKVTVTDSLSCTKTDSFFISNSPTATTSKIVKHTTCSLSNGIVKDSIISGGTPPFSYVWSNGVVLNNSTSTSHTISSLNSKTYYCTITDSKGCIKKDTFIVNPSIFLAIKLTKSNTNCGLPNGAVTSSIISGTPSYTYAWSNGSTTSNISSLAVGTYTLTVTDSIGCVAIQSITLVNNTNPILNTIKFDPRCSNNDGRIISNITGAKPPIVYNWSNGETTSFINGLAAGIYTLTITDSFGCQKVKSDTLLPPTLISFNSTVVQPNCALNNGSIALSSIAGVNPIFIKWNNGSSSSTRTGLGPGKYSVILTDSNFCTKKQTFTIDSSFKAKIDATVSHATCAKIVGSIVTSVTGGKPPYKYAWSSGDTTSSILNKPFGIYTLTVTDSLGCISIKKDTIKRMPTQTYKEKIYKSRCGQANGWILIDSIVGTGPYTFVWSSNPVHNDAFISNLPSDTVYLTMTDANGCVVKDTFDLTSFGPMIVTPTITNSACKDSTGKIVLNVTGVNPPIKIKWYRKGQVGVIDSSFTLDSLKFGWYIVSIIDSLGCTYFQEFKVKDITGIRDSFKIEKSRCDTFTGKITAFPYGGTSPYKYKWDRYPKDTFHILDSVAARDNLYELLVTDSNGCKYDTSVKMDYIYNPRLNFSLTPETCNSFNGSMTIWYDSVVYPVKKYWNGVLDTAHTKYNLPSPYSMSVLIVDSNKCKARLIDIEIPEIEVDSPKLSSIDPPCNKNLGVLKVLSKSPMDYLWSTGSTDSTIDSLAPGIYSVTVVDTSGCQFVLKDTLDYTNIPVLTHFINRPNCGQSDGSLTTLINAIDTLIQYEWYKLPASSGTILSNTSGTITHSGLDSSRYVLKVTDILGCYRLDTIKLKDSAAQKIGFQVTHSNCIQGTGKLKAYPLGGSPVYSYQWFDFTSADTVVDLNSGTYTLTMVDGRNCVTIDSATILFKPKPETNLFPQGATCGANNGEISTSISFGNSPMSYTWSHGASTKDLINLAGGIYRLTVTDNLGCKAYDTAIITSQLPVQFSLTKTSAFCGINNGSVTANITNGTPPFSFNWNGSISSLSMINLDSGYHKFLLIDSNNCIKFDSIYVPRVKQPLIDFNIKNDNCTYSIGQVTTTITGGKSPFTYSWSTGATTANLSNMAAGNYVLTLTDSMGCVLAQPATILDTAGPLVGLLVTNATCGLSNGNILATVVSSSLPLSYFWNNTAGSTTKSGINGGKYQFKVLDNRGCIRLDSVIVDTVFPLTYTKKVKHGSCFLNNAYIKLKPAGGTPPYSYIWSHTASNTDSIYGLTTGKYKVSISDSKGCMISDSIFVVQNGVPVITVSTIAATCGQPNGTINTALGNVFSPFNYTWSSGETSSIITNKLPGNYSFTISDGYGCSASSNASLTSKGVDSADLDILSPRCGFNNGRIKIKNAIHAVGTVSYSWNIAGNVDSISGLSPGTYSLTITDSLCTYTKTIVLSMKNTPKISLTKTDASCDINNAKVISSVNNGTSPYMYQWNSGPNSASIFFQDSGTYKVTVTDANGCQDTSSIYVSRIPGIRVLYTFVKSSCGKSNGSILATAMGGISPYTYLWSTGSSSTSMSNIYAGNYLITITDNNSCIKVDSFKLLDRSKPIIMVNVVQPVCAKDNGSLDINLIGGTPPFIYSWSTGQTTKKIINLGIGHYKVTVTDSLGCIDTMGVVLDPGTTPSYDIDSTFATNSTCGLPNGKIQVSMGRAVDPIFSWSNGMTGDKIYNLAAGRYIVTMNDSRGCIIPDTFDITTTTVPDIALNVSNSYCKLPIGSITSSVTQGTPPYSYFWSNLSSLPNLNNILPGNYKLTVIDIMGCNDTMTATVIEDPNTLKASVVGTNLKCFQDNSGAAIVFATGGTPPLKYYTNIPFPDSNLTSLNAGKHIYTVIDDKGCSFKDSFYLLEPNILKSRISSFTNLKCYNQPTGRIELATTGGTVPYSYLWSHSAINTNIANNLPADFYSIVTIDSQGCKDTTQHLLWQPDETKVYKTIINNPCFNDALGKISLRIENGANPFTYTWSNGSMSKDIANLKAGIYKLVLQDAKGCIDSFNYQVQDPDKLDTVNIKVSDQKCQNEINGAIIVTAKGGTKPYMYSIDSGKKFMKKGEFENLKGGYYQLVIKDYNDCKMNATTFVNSYPELKIRAYPHDTMVALDYSVQLGYEVIAGSKSWITDLLWSDAEGLNCVDCEAPVYHGYLDKKYLLTIHYFETCIAEDTVHIRLIDTNKLYIPNAFTPSKLSSYSENETFKVYSNKLKFAHVSVYNRWGEKVYENDHGNFTGWDGKFNGQDCQAGVYSYYVRATYLNNRIETYKGSVTLIR